MQHKPAIPIELDSVSLADPAKRPNHLPLKSGNSRFAFIRETQRPHKQIPPITEAANI